MKEKRGRGRPPIEPSKRVSENINSRITVEEFAMLERASERLDDTLSRIVRRLVVGCLVDESIRASALRSFDKCANEI